MLQPTAPPPMTTTLAVSGWSRSRSSRHGRIPSAEGAASTRSADASSAHSARAARVPSSMASWMRRGETASPTSRSSGTRPSSSWYRLSFALPPKERTTVSASMRRLGPGERVARAEAARHDRLRRRQRLQHHALAEEPRVEVRADALVDVLADHEVLARSASPGSPARPGGRRSSAPRSGRPRRRRRRAGPASRGRAARRPWWRRAAGRRPGGPGRGPSRRSRRSPRPASRASTSAAVAREPSRTSTPAFRTWPREPVGDHRVVLALRRPGGGEDLAAQQPGSPRGA